MTDDELLELFVQEFHLTPREGEVLDYLLHSDESMQDVAKQLAVSRAALYRHIANMNEKLRPRRAWDWYSSITAGRVKNSDFMGLLTF